MKKTALVLGLVCAASLVSCTNGTKKVSYEDFKKEVDKLGDIEYGNVHGKATKKLEGENEVKVERDFSKDTKASDFLDIQDADQLSLATMLYQYSQYTAKMIVYGENCTYYTGNGFRFVNEDEDGKMEAQFDKQGRITKFLNEEGKNKIEYVYSWK